MVLRSYRHLGIFSIGFAVGGRTADHRHTMNERGFEEIVRFHGHRCPGLAIGYRMTQAALRALDAERAADEEIVAIVENDACGVDAVQVLAGCTFGKGNLVFRDVGKSAYTFYVRSIGRGIRVVYHGDGMPEGLRSDRDDRMEWILTAPERDLLDLQHVDIDTPPQAVVHRSVRCAACGERVMETKTHAVGGRALCRPCADREASAPGG